MPSLPVRGFGEDGLLVTAGVGSSLPSEHQTITCSGAQVGLLGAQSGTAGIGVPEVAAAYGSSAPREFDHVQAHGAQTGLLGSQHAAGEVLPGLAYLTALCDLDEDLYAVTVREAA